MLKYLLSLIIVNYCYSLSWLHISDIHVDMKYHVGSANKCVEYSKLGTMCCRKFDIPINGSKPCSKYGDLNNDIPPLLFKSIMNWTKYNLNFDFIINTGDSGSHKDINQVFSNDNVDSINFVSDTIDELYPNIPVYNVIGNHDAFPNVDQTFPGYKTFLKKITKKWSKWVKDKNMLNYGYYSVNISDNIKIVTVNSLYYDKNNLFGINSTEEDNKRINNQMLWLNNSLNEAKNENRKVILLNHIGIMESESNDYMNKNLINILEYQKDNIILMLNGHSHESRFLLYKKEKKYKYFGLINPSIYTDNHYPMFRVYKNEEGKINFNEYYCNLTDIINNNKFKCKLSYNFVEEYNLINIDLDNMLDLYYKLNSNNSNYLKKYKKNYSPPNIVNSNYLKEIIHTI